jgi:asparagine synthase (glutamine-hydrolysing)
MPALVAYRASSDAAPVTDGLLGTALAALAERVGAHDPVATERATAEARSGQPVAEASAVVGRTGIAVGGGRLLRDGDLLAGSDGVNPELVAAALAALADGPDAAAKALADSIGSAGTGGSGAVILTDGSSLVLAGSPLYYGTHDGVVLVASEPAGVLAAGLPAAADDVVVRRFLLAGASDGGSATFFAGVSRLAAGEVCVVDGDGVRQVAGSVAGPAGTEPPDGRVGVRLSGPAGARLVGAVRAAAGGASIPVWAERVGPTEGGDDPALRPVLDALGETVRLERVEAGADQLAADLTAFTRLAGEPVPDPALWAIWATARAAAGTVEVLLDPAGVAAREKHKKAVDPAVLVRPAGEATAGGAAGGAGGAADAGSPAEGYGGIGPAAVRVAERVSARTGVRVLLSDAPGAVADAELERAAARLRPGPPVRQWLMRLKNRVYGIFLSESFAGRPWVAHQPVLVAFEDFIRNRTTDPLPFWRMLAVELWAREFLDPPEPDVDEAATRAPLTPNRDKHLAIDVDGASWLRFPIRTELFQRDDPYVDKIVSYVVDTVATASARPEHAAAFEQPWYVLASEKVVAISQGRSYFLWEIDPSWWARTLSKFVRRTPYGIGLGSPWTMHLAIKEAGLPRILAASLGSIAGKVIGRRGDFYRIAGHRVNAIDGPTEYSVFPANVSAKLPPAEPEAVAARLTAALRAALPAETARTLGGCVVIDANDLGRDVLGQDTDQPDSFFEQLFADNPLGQGSEQTPLAVAVLATAPPADRSSLTADHGDKYGK